MLYLVPISLCISGYMPHGSNNQVFDFILFILLVQVLFQPIYGFRYTCYKQIWKKTSPKLSIVVC